jgi:DNA repair protein RadC
MDRGGQMIGKMHISVVGDAVRLFRAAMSMEQREERVFVLPMDGSGCVLASPILVSIGTENGTAPVDAGMVLREALKAGAEEIIVAHNHPSGNMTPSKEDVHLTRELKIIAERLGVELLDHIIIGANISSPAKGYVSLAELDCF